MIIHSKTWRTRWMPTISWLEKPQCNLINLTLSILYHFHFNKTTSNNPKKSMMFVDLGERSGTFSLLFFVVFLRSPGKPSEALITGEACRRPVAFVATKASLCLSRLGSRKANESWDGSVRKVQHFESFWYIRTGCLVWSTVKGTKDFRFKLFFQHSTTLWRRATQPKNQQTNKPTNQPTNQPPTQPTSSTSAISTTYPPRNQPLTAPRNFCSRYIAPSSWARFISWSWNRRARCWKTCFFWR